MPCHALSVIGMLLLSVWPVHLTSPDMPAGTPPIAVPTRHVDALQGRGNTVLIGWRWLGTGKVSPPCASLQVVDISRPELPKVLWMSTGNKRAAVLAMEGDLAYVGWLSENVSTGMDSVEVFSLREPANPKSLGFFMGAPLASAYGDVPPETMAVKNGFVYLGHYNGIFILDMRDPAHPVLAGQYKTCPVLHEVRIEENRLFAACNGIEILDLEHPAAPRLIGRHASLGQAWGVALAAGNVALLPVEYLRGQVGRVSMIDISNVAMPRIIDRVTVGQGAWGVVAKEHTAFVQCGARVKVFNLANPDKPRRIRDIIPRQQASRLAIDGEHLFVGDVDGFQIWNIADPNMPKFLGQFSFS